MGIKRLLVACGLVVCLSTATAQALRGPFGLSQGMSMADVQRLGRLEPAKSNHWYTIRRLPDGHPDIDEYRVLVSPKHGLCKIIAWTAAIPSNAFGDQLRSKYEQLQDALTEKYGRSKKFDFLQNGSIWNDRRDFMMALSKNERSLATYWDEEERSTLTARLSTISLKAHAINSSSGIISISYEFENFIECDQWVKGQKNSNL